MRTWIGIVATTACLAAPGAASGQTVSAADREALVALHVSRGGQPSDLDDAIRLASEAGRKGLPLGPITDKIREGVAKRAAPARITLVVGELIGDLETADRLLREWAPQAARPARDAAATLLADALSHGVAVEDARVGVTADEARELARLLQPAGRAAAPLDLIASAAKALAFIKDAKLPAADGARLIADAARRGYGAYDLVDLGRQIKLRERDYQSGRATLVALREAIARGERPERLFRDHPARVERLPTRPNDARPPAPSERPVRPDRPQRPDRVGRP